jgi:hypothetical protein
MTMADKIKRARMDIDEVHEAGRTLEHRRIWDFVQTNGKRTNYADYYGFFGGSCWNSNTFYPKYDIRPEGNASYLFYAWEADYGHTTVLDLKQRLIDCGVVLDTSKATNLSYMFAYSTFIDNIPTLDLRSLAANARNLFSSVWNFHMKTIEKLIVHENQTFWEWFLNVLSLETVIFEGTIGQSGLDMRSCEKLNKASITSIINCLSTTTSGLHIYLSKTAVNKAFTTAEWTALSGTRSNWTISLV